MPSLKALRGRIASVKSTQKITSAMKMVAASKLRRAQAQAEAARPYVQRIERMLGGLSAGVAGTPEAPRLLAGTGSDQVHLLIPVTGDRGLAGAFNANVGRLTRNIARQLESDGKTVKIFAVGRKGRDYLRREFPEQMVGDVNYVGRKAIAFSDAAAIAARVIAMLDAGEIDVCTIIYNRFQSVISQVPTEQRLIPAPPPAEAGTGLTYDVEPDEQPILARLLPQTPRGADLPRPAGQRRRLLRLADDGDGQRHAQCGRHDQAPDAELQPCPPGQHYPGTDRDHLRRRSRLKALA